MGLFAGMNRLLDRVNRPKGASPRAVSPKAVRLKAVHPKPVTASVAIVGIVALGVALAGGLTAPLAGAVPPAEAAAGRAVASSEQPARTLTVHGEARVTAPPDTAIVRLGMWARSEEARGAQRLVSAAARRVVDAMERLGVPREALKTVGLRLSPVFPDDDRRREREPVGYEAHYGLEVRIEQLEQVGAVIDEAVRAGANRIDGVAFTVRSVDALKEQALARAVADAVKQAQVLAEAAGARLGPLVSVGGVQFGAPPVVRPMAPLARVALEAATPVEPGELEFTASVTLVYELR